jgi:glycosyltransferase involved in cell wall biosynthesis
MRLPFMGKAISVIIPAYNEERYLPRTLEHVHRAQDHLGASHDDHVEIIVVDNASTDRTADIAMASGARVVPVPEHNIARVRNAGALAASGDLFVFLDADTLIPNTLLSRVASVMDDPTCLGGAVDTDYQPARASIRVYLGLWRLIGIIWGMAQGATQFCRRDTFTALGGYDETIYMGEDVDFYWRLGRFARSQGRRLEYVKDLRVVPSCRRYDQWSLSRTLVLTNPLLITLFRRRRSPWSGWYDDAPR